ncbi:MAG: MATE family efflux transporter [Chloroflexi bacterium]|nr:MATE family efflux transporter [Chloroflexota bacterium]
MNGAGRSSMQRDWTQGSILRNLLALSWPMMVTNSVNMLGPTVDMIWVGRLGAASIAGVGVAGMAVMVLNSLFMGLFTGLRAMVARSVGARDEASAIHIARQALAVGTVSSITIAFVGLFLAEPIMRLTGVQEDVITEGAAYLRISLVGMVAMTFRFMADSVMQASGDTITPMKISIIFRIFHVILAPFLIFGWWIFPRLEVSGAALTQVFSAGVGTALGFWFLFTGRSRLHLTLSRFHIDSGVIWRLVKIGIPASAMGMERSLGQFILMWFMVPFGTVAVAAHTLNQRIEMFLFVPVFGMGMAASVLTGQNLGAGQPQRAEKSVWLAVALAQGALVIFAAAMLLWAEKFVYVFSSNPGVVEAGSAFLRIAVAGYLLIGVTAILQQGLSGAGDTTAPMLVSLLSMWVVQVPLAYFLPKVAGLGAFGVRWAIVAGIVVGAIAYILYFRLGRWKRQQV